MPNRRFAAVLAPLTVALAVVLVAPSARGELLAWDQPRVGRIVQDLAKATDALQKTFDQQPPPPKTGSLQSEAYYDLKHLVWLLDVQADLLGKSLQAGDGRQQTLWIYEIMMSAARSARYKAASVFVADDVGKRAGAVRGVLNELGPYYDPDFQTLAPDPNVERPSTP